MNEELKEKLRKQGKTVGEAIFRHRTAKGELARFDATARLAVKSDGMKRTEADTDAAVLADPKRASLEVELIATEAELEQVKTDTQCILAEVSLVCAETAAMSRISQ